MKAAPWSPDALDLAKKRYLVKEDLSIEQWLNRVCGHICRLYSGEKHEILLKQYFDLLYSRSFLPTSAALHNSLSGRGSLAGCIVLPLPQTTREVIQQAIPEIAEVLFSGIGVGIDLTVLPPRLSKDETTQRANPGPVELLFSITNAVESAMNYSGVKRSAFMAALHVQHPDIFEFIKMKADQQLGNVNISVTIDEQFTTALENKTLLPVVWNEQPLSVSDLKRMQEQSISRHLPHPDLWIQSSCKLYSHSAEGIVGEVIEDKLYFNPETILDQIALHAHACGDPGLINLSAISLDNPTHPRHASADARGVGEIRVTTPCGEQPLLPYEVCHLGSVNLAVFASESTFNFKGFIQTVRTAVRFMDDLIDSGDNGLEEANMVTEANRKIGIGVMGLADVLAELEYPYDSPEALQLTDQIGKTLLETAIKESQALAAEKGAFPNWEHSKFAQDGEVPRRHATLTTIAPTGHISTLAGCSTAIEPYFLVSYGRDAAGKRLHISGVLLKKLEKLGFSLEEWISRTRQTQPDYQFDGTLAGLCDSPTSDPQVNSRLQKLKKVFATAHEIKPDSHIAIVEVLQKYIENGISKTINLPENASVTDVKEIYLKCIRSGLKGMTVFRDRCLEQQAIYALEACPECSQSHFLQPGDCAGWKCDKERGGCGWETCSIA